MPAKTKLMDSSASSKRKLRPFVPDIAYHIQIIFIFTFSYIWYSAFVDQDYLEPLPSDEAAAHKITLANWWRGIIGCILFLCAFAYLEPYHLDFFHPMQRFWRIISMLAMIYFCLVIVLLNHRPGYGRWVLGYLDPRLNQPVTKGHHTYDDDCDITWENVLSNFDHYYAVHCINWFLSSFVIRDFYILHFWQVLDEFVELSWQHILPHFRECWWDHIFCDILLSNIPAITVGLYCQRRLGLKSYNWWGKDYETKPFLEWDAWHCHKRFGVIVYIQILLTIHFLAGFFLNNNLLIPPIHPFPILRLLLWFGLGSIAFREGYEDANTWGTVKRKHVQVEGRYRWLTVAILTTETVLCWKYRKNTGHINEEAARNTPIYIWLPWVAAFAAMMGWWCYLRFKPEATVKYIEGSEYYDSDYDSAGSPASPPPKKYNKGYSKNKKDKKE